MATRTTAATIAPVLRAAAARVAGLAYARVVRTDVHHALLLSSPQYDIAQAALDTLAAHIPAPGWLARWAEPRGRDDVAAELRAAANAVELVEAGDCSAESFDWTRELDGQVRRDVTTCLEVGQRAFLHLRPASAGGAV